MFRPSRYISISLLAVGLLISGLSDSAEAQRSRRGSKATLGDTDIIELEYVFSIFDTTAEGLQIEDICDEQGTSCLFEDAVSDLVFNELKSAGPPLSQVRIGTKANSLVFREQQGTGYPNGFDLSNDLGQFPVLNLRSEWDDGTNTILYGITDPRDASENIELKIFPTTQSGAGTETFALGFELFRRDSQDPDNNQTLDSRLVNNLVTDLDFVLDTLNTVTVNPDNALEFIVQTPSGPLNIQPLGGGGEFEIEVEETISDISGSDSVDVPEPASIVGLLLFTFLGVKGSKKQLS